MTGSAQSAGDHMLKSMAVLVQSIGSPSPAAQSSGARTLSVSAVTQDCRDSIRCDPSSNGCSLGVGKVVAQRQDRLKALPSIVGALSRTRRWADLVELHEQALPGLNEPDTVEALQAILEIQSQHLEMPELRIPATAGRLYWLKPEDLDAAQSLIDLGDSLGCVDEAVAILEDQIDDIRDSRVRLARLMQVAELYHRTLRDLDAAGTAYERALGYRGRRCLGWFA